MRSVAPTEEDRLSVFRGSLEEHVHLTGMKLQEPRENNAVKGSIICSFHQIFLG
jgi:hypothetical protein